MFTLSIFNQLIGEFFFISLATYDFALYLATTLDFDGYSTAYIIENATGEIIFEKPLDKILKM